MRFSFAAYAALLFPLSSDASFLRDVVNQGTTKQNVENALLAKAVPLDEYKEHLRKNGQETINIHREMEDGDDYYVDPDYMYSFSGYALKYSECQPVQRFSEDAIAAGQYTPMVVDDIVVLRLCRSTSCSASKAYGCYSNYAEYAISVSDYIRVMLRYQMDKKEQMCNWCNGCIAGGRKLEDNGGDQQGNNQGQDNGQGQDNAQQNEGEQGNNQNQENEQQQGQQENNQQQEEAQADEQNQQENQQQEQQDDENGQQQQENDNAENNDAQGDDNVAQGDDNVNGDYQNEAAGDDYWNNDYQANGEYDQNSNDCSDYETYCYDEYGYSICDSEEDDSYLNAEGYLNYMDCVGVNGYYVRPRCDVYDKTISMGVFYDSFCSDYAGDKINMNSLGLGIQPEFFQAFYDDVECIDCSQNDYAPYFDANTTMCNAIHSHSDVCADNLQYDLFGGSSSDGICSFIENIRIGNYDAYGQIAAGWKYGDSFAREVTDQQKAMLALSILLCIALVIYSCYLHHSLTNFLLRSLSHADLLPSRSKLSQSSSHRRRRSSSRSRSRGRRRVPTVTESDDSDEWEQARRPPRRFSRNRSRKN